MRPATLPLAHDLPSPWVGFIFNDSVANVSFDTSLHPEVVSAIASLPEYTCQLTQPGMYNSATPAAYAQAPHGL